MTALVLLGVVVAIGAAAVAIYNRLVRFKNGGESAWSDIDVQLKRRHELIPNVVETVKGYASHERATLGSRTSGPTRSPTSIRSRRRGTRGGTRGFQSRGFVSDIGRSMDTMGSTMASRPKGAGSSGFGGGSW